MGLADGCNINYPAIFTNILIIFTVYHCHLPSLQRIQKQNDQYSIESNEQFFLSMRKNSEKNLIFHRKEVGGRR